jgi:hypothetical protein
MTRNSTMYWVERKVFALFKWKVNHFLNIFTTLINYIISIACYYRLPTCHELFNSGIVKKFLVCLRHLFENAKTFRSTQYNISRLITCKEQTAVYSENKTKLTKTLPAKWGLTVRWSRWYTQLLLSVPFNLASIRRQPGVKEVRTTHTARAVIITTFQNNISKLYAQYEVCSFNNGANTAALNVFWPMNSCLPSRCINRAVTSRAKIATMESRRQVACHGQYHSL